MKKTTIILMMLAASLTIAAQRDTTTFIVKGSVCDAATGDPIPGVIVEAYGNNKFSAMTDETGKYEVKVPHRTSSVMMRVDGYNIQQCAVGKSHDAVDARMYTISFSSQYNRTTSASKQKETSQFDNSSVESIDPFISERLGADVRSISRGANVGLGNMMLINGINSLQANAQPLIVIDGVVTDMQYSRSVIHDGYYNNLLANINVNDIEKVTVLKNGTAIYGAKGANGVLLIQTKRNKSMATKIDVTINGRYDLIPKLPEMMNAEDYRLYSTELLASTPVNNISGLKFLNNDPTYYYYKQYHNNTDWTKEVYHNTFSQNYGINVQGGDDVANYNLSVGYSYANSTLKDNDFSRFNMRLNTDIELLRNLTCRFDASYSDINRDLRDDGVSEDITNTTVTSPGLLGLIKSPFLNPYAFDVKGTQSSYLENADNYLSEVFGSDNSLANPSSILAYGEGKNRNTFGNRIINIAITPKYNFNRHLTLYEHFSFSLINTNENYYLPISGVPAFKVEGLSSTTYVYNIAESLAGRQSSISSDTRLEWGNRYGAHKLSLFGGVRYLSDNYKLNIQKGYNTGNDKTPNMNNSLAYKSTSGADDKCRDITWYANADYNYAEKYYCTAGLSAETSSRFGKDADGLDMLGVVWGLFPSIQGAWVLSNEPWMTKIKGINYMKLNVGFDVSGNDDIDYTASRTYFKANTMIGNSVDGLSIANIGNNSLKWETTKRFTAGIETNILNNRVNLQLNYFKSWTSNLLTLKQLAYTSGLAENWSNNGKLENEGFDVSAMLKVLNLKNWKWQIGASAGHYVNKITALPDDNKSFTTSIYGATILSQVGSPVGLFHGYKTNGVFSTTAEAKSAAIYQLTESGKKEYFKAGDMKFVDLDPNNCIDENDRTVIGNPNPDIFGNISSNLSFKNWTLNAVFNYSLGNDVFNYERMVLEGGSYFYNQTTTMNNRWTCEGQMTDIPRIDYQDEMGNSRFSDRWIEDGSYIRLRSLTLSYVLPVRSTYLQGITFWGSAENLFTITKYLGTDPNCSLGNSVLSQGIDRGLLGSGRSFSLGIKINL